VSLMIIQNFKQILNLKKDYFWIWWSIQMSLWIYIIDEMELGLKISINNKHKSKEQHWKKNTSPKMLIKHLVYNGWKEKKKKDKSKTTYYSLRKAFLT
jgi:hypothetical protein